jgi:hypothetical protein
VKQDNLGEYEENVTEKQNDTNIQDKHKLPLKPSHKGGKHQFPPTKQQREKHKGVW